MQLAKHAGFQAVDSGLGRMIAEDGRQGDTLFTGLGHGGKDLVVDYSIANACAPSYIQQSAHVQGHAMHLREDAKNTMYKEQYRRLGVDFKPLVMEMHGAISDTFLKFIKKLASAAADRHDRPYCIIFSYWQHRISTVLQKFNARILYLTQCKIDGTRPCGGLGFANELKEIMFDEERFYGSSMYV